LGNLFALALIVPLAACAGCGKPLASLEGTVTLDGQPVEQGSIVLLPVDGSGPTSGAGIENDKYRVALNAGIMPGQKTVQIIGIRKTGKQVEAGPPSPPGTMVDLVEQCVPDIYNTKSTLTVEVLAGQINQHDFDLKSP